MPLAELALRFCLSRYYATSTIIGATSVEQLIQNLDAFEVDGDKPPLAQELVDKIDRVHECTQNICLSIDSAVPHSI